MVHADGDPKVREIPFQVCLIGEKEAKFYSGLSSTKCTRMGFLQGLIEFSQEIPNIIFILFFGFQWMSLIFDVAMSS